MGKRINQRGVTLVEILAVIVIVGIFSVIIWRLFFQATELNNREVTQNTLQQEANLIVNNMHITHTEEEIKSMYTNLKNTQLIITIKDKDPIVFNKPGIIYEYEINPPKIDSEDDEDWPNPFDFYIKLTSSKNEKISFSTRSTFSKLKAYK